MFYKGFVYHPEVYEFTPEFLLHPHKKGFLFRAIWLNVEAVSINVFTSVYGLLHPKQKKNGWNLQLITCSQPLRKNGYITLKLTPKRLKYSSLHVFSHGNFGATLKMVPNVPPFFPYCFPCLKRSPSHDFFMVMSRRGKKLGIFGCRPHNEPSHFLLRHRRVTTWPPSQAIVISWRDITYQVMMLLFVTTRKGDNPRYMVI